MPVLPVLALVIGLAAPTAEVTADVLDVYDAPGAAAMRTGRLARGSRVRVRGEEGDWLAIEPPKGSFSWIEETAIQETDDGRARVRVDRATVRPGSPGARLPGPPGVELGRGQAVVLLDRRPLTIRQGARARTWRAIAAPKAESRYVRADGVDRGEPPLAAEPLSPRLRLAARATVDPELSAPPAPSAELATALEGIEDRHRRAVRGPLESWQLGPVRDAYRELLRRQSGPAARAAVQARLDQVDRQLRLAAEARSFLAVVDLSRRRDTQLAEIPAGDESSSRPKRETYDARGLLQPSSREAGGQRLFALIGADGATIAYLDIPPGLDPTPLVGHRVGVRGAIHFDEELNARLFAVKDLDDLGD